MATPTDSDETASAPGVTILIDESQPLVLDAAVVQNIIGRVSALAFSRCLSSFVLCHLKF